MVDNLFATVNERILRSVTDADPLLIVQHSSIEDEFVEEKGRSFDSVAFARSIFPFTSKTEVAKGSVLDSLKMLRAIIRKSSLSSFCLQPSWTILSRGSFPKADVRKLRQEIRKQYPVAQGQVFLSDLAIYEALQSMAAGMTLMVLAPTSILAAHSSSRLRSYIAKNHTLRWVVEFTDMSFQEEVFSGFRICSLLIESGQSKFHPVKYLRLPQVTEHSHELLLEEVSRLARQQGGETTHGYVLRERLPDDTSLLFSANHPRWDRYTEDLASVGGMLFLEEVAEIFISGRFRPKEAQKSTIKNAVLITGREITPSGELVIEAKDENRPAQNDYRKLQPGDIVLRSLVPRQHQSSIPAAIVPDDREVQLYAGRGVIIVRLHEELKGIDPQWLHYFLQSSWVADWLRSRIMGVTIPIHYLRQLPVPIRDDDTTALWRQSGQLLDEFTNFRNHLEAARRNLFQHRTVKAGHAELIAVTLGASQKASAAKATETLGWKIRNLYPYPLAIRWREIEAMNVSYRKYRRVLETAEVLVTYLAIKGLVLAEYYRDGELSGYLHTIAKRLDERPKSGMNFGDWLQILTEVAVGRRYRSVGPGTPFFEVTSLFETGNVRQALGDLKRLRDDDAHGRGPKSEQEITDFLAEAESALRVAYRDADFVTRYPLRIIESAIHKARQDQIEYGYRDLMGDHPLVPIENATRPGRTSVEQGALYFATPDEELFLVQPWLVRRTCPTCGRKEVYTFDRLDNVSKAILIKSLDNGHVMEADELRPEFQQVGILLEQTISGE